MSCKELFYLTVAALILLVTLAIVKAQAQALPMQTPAQKSFPPIPETDNLTIQNAQLRVNIAVEKLKATQAYKDMEAIAKEQGDRIQTVVAAFEKAHPDCKCTIDTAVFPFKVVDKKDAK